MDQDSPVARALASLTTEQKHELTALGITPQKRSDWVHTSRKPTVAQLKTLAIITGFDLAPMLEWLAKEQATPEQLDLFLRALAKTTAALALVILSGAENHADAASMRAAELTSQFTGTHIMRSSDELNGFFSAPTR